MGKRSKKNVIDNANDAAEGIRHDLESVYHDARDMAAPIIKDAKDMAAPIIKDAKAKAGPIVKDAYDKAGPMLHDAKEKAAPIIADAREKAAPYIAEGKAKATETAVAGRDATVAKVNELRGIEPEPKGSKTKKFLIVGVVVGLAAVVYKKLTDSPAAGNNWQSSYTPAPAPKPAAAPAAAPMAGQPLHPGAVAADSDQAAASPDEALADAAEAPHPDTTPDDPANVVELDPDKNA